MDWFEALTGFAESDYHTTRARLAVEGQHLVSLANGARFGIGRLRLASLHALRTEAASHPATGRLTLSNISADVRDLHRDTANRGALFQVASQFNLLEMAHPDLSPEDGVAGYQFDPTQGPACAIAAGAATIYRNYFVPVDGGIGQTATRQINASAQLRAALAARLGWPPGRPWALRNGYALSDLEALEAVGGLIGAADPAEREALKGELRIGLHQDVEVTTAGDPRQFVSQAFCSAMPVAYGGLPAEPWAPLATLVLEAAYEATLAAATLNAAHGGSRVVYLTRLGGGAFGNAPTWIDQALRAALRRYRETGLEVRLVSHGAVPAEMRALEREFG
ncbi:MAG: hypothetical protein JWM33_2202 [Caulobacteraceae bacterium]|nr:hypothetical protein [Caulobacteraceae bacterium]